MTTEAIEEKKKAKMLVIQDTVKINGKTYKVTGIAEGACKDMSKLASLTVGKNVKTIGAGAFNGCGKMKKITILGTVLKKVGENAFSGTPKKTTVFCPKKKIKAYTKLLQNAGLAKTATIQAAK